MRRTRYNAVNSQPTPLASCSPVAFRSETAGHHRTGWSAWGISYFLRGLQRLSHLSLDSGRFEMIYTAYAKFFEFSRRRCRPLFGITARVKSMNR